MVEEQKPDTISFTVSAMPKSVFERFKEFARTEAGDCYWMAIDKMMTMVEEDWKMNLLFDEIKSIKYRLDELESKKKEPDEEVKTFGGE